MLFCKKAVEEDIITSLKEELAYKEHELAQSDKIIAGLKKSLSESVVDSDDQKFTIKDLKEENVILRDIIESYKNVKCKFIFNKEKDIMSIVRSRTHNHPEHTLVSYMNADGFITTSKYVISRKCHNMLCERINKGEERFLLVQ